MIPIGLENKRHRDVFVIEGNPLDENSPGKIELFNKKFIHPFMHFYLMAEPMGPVMANTHFTGATETVVRPKQPAIKFGNKTLIYSARLWQRYQPIKVKRNIIVRTTENGKTVHSSQRRILVPDVITSLETSHNPNVVKRRLVGERPPQPIDYEIDSSLYIMMLILADGRVYIPWGSYDSIVERLHDLPGLESLKAS